MALYLGTEKVNLFIGGTRYCIQTPRPNKRPIKPAAQNVLFTADGFILTDSNGLYLIPKTTETFNTSDIINV